MNHVYTSSGIIKNRDIPRVGVVGVNTLCEWIYDEIDQGIDLTWEEFSAELDAKVESGEMTENDAERERDTYEHDSRTILVGSWKKNESGKYVPDESGEYAATYSSGSGNMCVEWSKTLKRVHHTSPCYVMADGSGPCGDLNTPGDSVLAYSLPEDMFRSEES